MKNGNVKKRQLGGFELISIENEDILAEFNPSVGGKMIHLIDKNSACEWLLQPQNENKGYRRAVFGDDFQKYDTSGFDECFPTVEACIYKRPGENGVRRALELPDHGELWSRPWKYSLGDQKICLSISGVGIDYLFSKEITLEGNRICVNYRLKNQSTETFAFLWSAHPLLAVVPGSKLLLPERMNQVCLEWSSDQKIGSRGDVFQWPYASDGTTSFDFSIVQDGIFGRAVKCFSGPLDEGYAGVYDPRHDRSILFEFSPFENPFLGIWLCYGGWPTTTEKKHLTVALEPCNGRTDSLARAIERGEYVEIQPAAEKKWSLAISLWSGNPKMSKATNEASHSYSL